MENGILIFREMELSSPKIKKFKREISELGKYKKPTVKKFLIFQDMELSTLKLSYFSKKNFLYFRWELFLLKFLVFSLFSKK